MGSHCRLSSKIFLAQRCLRRALNAPTAASPPRSFRNSRYPRFALGNRGQRVHGSVAVLTPSDINFAPFWGFMLLQKLKSRASQDSFLRSGLLGDKVSGGRGTGDGCPPPLPQYGIPRPVPCPADGQGPTASEAPRTTESTAAPPKDHDLHRCTPERPRLAPPHPRKTTTAVKMPVCLIVIP